MGKLSRKAVRKYLGSDLGKVSREIRNFSEAAKILSSNRPRMIDEHAWQWVGVYEGRVAATSDSLDNLMAELNKAGIPADKTIIRHITPKEKTLIL